MLVTVTVNIKKFSVNVILDGNNYGQLGDGTGTDRKTPITVQGLK